MARLDEKDLQKRQFQDDIARAYFKKHLAYRGYVVEESDSQGPVRILVGTLTELQTWSRDGKDGSDFRFKLEATRAWSFK